MIHIYIGDGKGKTTAAIGLSVRYAGSGKKVRIFQFLKDGSSSELCFLKNTDICVTPCQTRVKGFFWDMCDEEKNDLKKETEENFCSAEKALKNCDMVVLDELSGAIFNGLISVEKVTALLTKYADTKEIVITGRSLPDEILKMAHYVSEIKSIKHPFENGGKAQKGIEF